MSNQNENKKSFVERYEENQKLKKKLLKSKPYLYAVIGLPICLVISFLWNLSYFGSGAFCYSDQAYENIATAMSECSFAEHGFDRDTFKTKVDRYVETYDNGKTFIEGTLKFGYFEAILTMEMDKDHHIIDNTGTKNYASVDDYMRKFILKFGSYVLVIGLGSWFIIGKISHFLLAAIIWAIRKDKPSNETIEEIVPQTESKVIVETESSSEDPKDTENSNSVMSVVSVA